jgi:hypothetical protein
VRTLTDTCPLTHAYPGRTALVLPAWDAPQGDGTQHRHVLVPPATPRGRFRRLLDGKVDRRSARRTSCDIPPLRLPGRTRVANSGWSGGSRRPRRIPNARKRGVLIVLVTLGSRVQSQPGVLGGLAEPGILRAGAWPALVLARGMPWSIVQVGTYPARSRAVLSGYVERAIGDGGGGDGDRDRPQEHLHAYGAVRRSDGHSFDRAPSWDCQFHGWLVETSAHEHAKRSSFTKAMSSPVYGSSVTCRTLRPVT